MNKEIREILRTHWLFGVLPADEIEDIVRQSNVQKYSHNQTIFMEGDPANNLYIIVSGDISVEIMSIEGRVLSFATLGAGDIFGEFAVLDGGVRSASARALEETKIMLLHKNFFLRLLSRNSEFSMKLMIELVCRLRESNDNVENFVIASLKDRLIILLVKLVEDSPERYPVVKLTQQELADRLSASREKVNVNLRVLDRQNFISRKRGSIKILDIAGLKLAVE